MNYLNIELCNRFVKPFVERERGAHSSEIITSATISKLSSLGYPDGNA
jgi:hypothetical protein